MFWFFDRKCSVNLYEYLVGFAARERQILDYFNVVFQNWLQKLRKAMVYVIVATKSSLRIANLRLCD